ncbi:ABC transporter substrate-binding protein [Sesbania bispinosa]|nr:ABC transporter substrate-binding protein [Sesbania bispinosa]
MDILASLMSRRTECAPHKLVLWIPPPDNFIALNTMAAPWGIQDQLGLGAFFETQVVLGLWDSTVIRVFQIALKQKLKRYLRD